MTAPSSLDRLAEAYDIEPGYTDIWKQPHQIGVETKLALLAAMGVSVGGDAEIEASLLEVEAKAFERLSLEVMVRREGDRIELSLAMDEAQSGRLSWSVLTEDGASYSGDASVKDLQATGPAEVRGRTRTADNVRRSLPLILDLPPGYHRAVITLGEASPVETEIIVAPKRAFWPAELDRENGLIGVTAPLYGLQSARNAGVGDVGDLATLAEKLSPLGASFVGINPVHALFPKQPKRFSPYAPSSRRFLNAMTIALDQVPELESSHEAQTLMASPLSDQLRTSDLVDYVGVATFKLDVLEALFLAFCRLPPSSLRRARFQAFCEAGGEPLERHTRFEALAEFFSGDDGRTMDWHNWPDAYQSPDSGAVQDFALLHADRVMFYAYLQWLAFDQLEQAQETALAAGMPIGLYLDLAVGVASDGAEAWSDQEVLVNDVRIGAPPDDFNPGGQNWGLLPLSPSALRARCYRPFIDLLRSTMRHAGALRIDHVLGLARSFWLPADRDIPGAYIRYPMQDLLGLVALESQRQRCVVIGEDLGTVPETLRSALDEHGLLGCRLLYFERDEQGGCRPASTYPKACIASIGSHDLPTLKGFWQGRDIDWREQLGLYADAEQSSHDRTERRQVAKKLLGLLAKEGLLPDGIDPLQPEDTMSQGLVEAFHQFLSRTPAALKVIQLEDAVGAIEQANLPGTIDEHPNWCRKIGVPIEQLSSHQGLLALLRLL